MPSQQQNSYLSGPRNQSELDEYTVRFADRFHINDQASRIKTIMAQLLRKPYFQQQFTGDGLALSLEEAFYNLSPEQALGLFEKADLDVLANRVSLIRNWAGELEPFYTHEELAEEIRAFDGFCEEKRDSLLGYGYPYEYFALDKFFLKLTLLNPTLDPGWRYGRIGTPFAESLVRWDDFSALNFKPEDVIFIEKMRMNLHYIKAELCILFYHALAHKEHTPQTLCEGLGQILSKHLNRDEANRLFDRERKYAGLFKYKAKLMDEWNGLQAEFPVDIGSGGLNAIIEATLFIAGEIESSRMHKTKVMLAQLLSGRELSSYYRLWQTMGSREVKKLDAFLDQNSDYFKVMANYGKHFEPLLMDSIKKHITIPVVVKKEHADTISHAAKHLEQGGEIRLGELAYTATGTKSLKPHKLKENATPDAIIPEEFEVNITGLKNPKQQIFIDGRKVQLSEAGFLLFLRLAVARKSSEDGMMILKNETLVPNLSHQKVQRLRQDLAYQLKSDVELVGNDDSGGYCLKTIASRIKINIRTLRKQGDGHIDEILKLLLKV